MGTPLRAILATSAALLACSLQAESGPWSGMLGAALPSSGSKAWVGSTVGPSLDIMETYALGSHDAIRMRFGYWALKASSSATDVVTATGYPAITCPAETTNQLFGFSYGAEYVRLLPARLFVLGGLGVTYLTASRTGTFDLGTISKGVVSTSYSSNNFVPYVTAGLGVQITQALALEARWQTSTMKAQTRPIDLTAAGLGTGQEQFAKLNTSTLTVGLSLNF